MIITHEHICRHHVVILRDGNGKTVLSLQFDQVLNWRAGLVKPKGKFFLFIISVFSLLHILRIVVFNHV